MRSWFTPRRETRTDDEARTRRLLDAADIAFDLGPVPDWDVFDEDDWAADFEAVVMEGLLTDVEAAVYPPAGHTYPKRETTEENAR
ncbi:hypothetical protein ACWEP8_39760 [Streptomyces hydrogenans]